MCIVQFIEYLWVLHDYHIQSWMTEIDRACFKEGRNRNNMINKGNLRLWKEERGKLKNR